MSAFAEDLAKFYVGRHPIPDYSPRQNNTNSVISGGRDGWAWRPWRPFVPREIVEPRDFVQSWDDFMCDDDMYIVESKQWPVPQQDCLYMEVA
jgi:hypothetical protein